MWGRRTGVACGCLLYFLVDFYLGCCLWVSGLWDLRPGRGCRDGDLPWPVFYLLLVRVILQLGGSEVTEPEVPVGQAELLPSGQAESSKASQGRWGL